MTAALAALAALGGLLAVAVGAFGAHAMTDPQAKAWVTTGAVYGLAHAATALAVMSRAPATAWSLTLGALVFSGSLYLMAFGLPRWLGAVTPMGGVLMIVGWALLIWHALRS